ncbi:hypothetical protein [Arthrobacter sp. NPDC058192]|uniref:hypothetical protein n=1 Tax=Arthrobacter sp. NPDC058192 TaxID=3346372 RepID=UPI0036F0C04E
MSAEQNGTEEDVHDGVQDGAPPVPKDAPDGGETTAGAPSGPSDSTDASTKATGPAEEQDKETPDSRGLTTDTAPGD